MSKVFDVAVEVTQQAGDELLRWWDRLEKKDVSSKSASRDLVTAADLAAEKLIFKRLQEAFPEDGFLGEETGAQDLEAEHVWVVDPLDGTNNFVHRLPMFAVSIARVSRGVPSVGVVYLPRLQETFSAERGQGATLNGKAIQVSSTTQLADAMLATGFPYRRHLLVDNNLENFNRLFLQQRGVRRMGSAACDLAYVACGRLDAYWELHLSAYDVAAGGLLVREAGGVVDTIVPGGDWISGANILAGPPKLVECLRAELRKGRGDDYPPLGDR
jgi:myo-inositol-1(or 4)-monophosphatase